MVDKIAEFVLADFVADMDKAFTNAVMRDDWQGIRKFCRKYGMGIPKDRKVLKASVYKAVQCCIDIPESVKSEAFKKCFAMGFNPLIEPYRADSEDDAE